MIDWDSLLNPKFIYLILGVIFLSLAVLSTFTGKAYSGYGGWARRAKQPTQFWCGVVVMGLSAIVCIGIAFKLVEPKSGHAPANASD